MVVLSVAITTKTGKALLSRQFVEMSRSRIEGLLSAFPKLMGIEKQHTFIETDNVRYLYQPLENLYVLLVTNKTSNILEDLETLHLLAKIVPEYSKVLDEKEIIKNAFDIIFAFDEAVAMGYKERVTLQQIKHFISMESHDEIRHKLEEKNKMLVAKKEAEKVRKQIEKKKAEDKKFGISMDQHSSSSLSSGSSSASRSSFASEPTVETKKETPKTEPKFSKGMQLGKGKKPSAVSQILKEENVPEAVSAKPGSVSDVPTSNEKIRVSISEKLVLVSQNDGGLENMEVKGELIVTAFDPNFAKLKVQVNQGDNPDFQFKAHPNMNKNLYANDNILALKDSSKAFPVGTASSILKWRYATKDEKMIPLTINVWPQTSGGETSVPIEYEKNCDFDLADVTITLHIPGGAPVIGDIEQGTAEYDSKKQILSWKIPLIDDSNKTGSMEFTVPPAQNSAFFPVTVDFRSNQTFCALQVVGVTLEDGNKPADFASEVSLTVEQFEIQ